MTRGGTLSMRGAYVVLAMSVVAFVVTTALLWRMLS